jgi:uncharacterized protein YndB with AHSA1/START domain
MSQTDRIEKRVTLHAPVARVWKAIVDSDEFGRWFGVRLDGAFEVGQSIFGTFERLPDESAIVSYQRSLGLEPSAVRLPDRPIVFCTVERIEPERYFSFRWIPYGIDAAIDPASEPSTLVEFSLEPAGQDTALTIAESGFDRVPAHRRQRAFLMNDRGWTSQSENICRHVEAAAA